MANSFKTMRTPSSLRPEGSAAGPEPAAEVEADLVVVGAGVAGLRAAIETAAAGLRVQLLAKAPPSDSNTDKAQGGIAVAMSDEDEVGLHFRDTVAAGAGLCDRPAVHVMVGEGPEIIAQLIDWGATFDKEGSHLAFTREGAHSARRVLHAGGDSTGHEILRALIAKARAMDGLSLRPDLFTTDLLVKDGRCRGIVCLDPQGRSVTVRGPVLLATGGCGQVFSETTNPPQATGDGIAMAWRAGAWLRDMEFVQFHPTALALEGAPRFLLSEALRGEGGVLRDIKGERFMLEEDPRQAELAPRDVVSRAIASRMAQTGSSHVWLDMSARDGEFLRRRFPKIHATCLAYGIDIAAGPIPVSPCAHYMMGGVATDLHGRTAIPGLYAAGEAACTGVHGANRLASNSLLEGLVFGARAGAAAAADLRGGREQPLDLSAHGTAWEAARPSWRDCPDRVRREAAESVAAEVREIAWSGAGLIRDAGSLESALGRLAGLAGAAGSAAADPVTREGAEAANLLQVAFLVASAASLRRESRGAHFRSDHPQRDDQHFRVSVVSRRGGECRTLPVA